MAHVDVQSDRTPSETLHTAYIAEVVRSLAASGVPADTDRVTVLAGPPRLASTLIDPEVVGRWRDAEWMALAWSERSGWSWQVKFAHEPIPRDAVYFGVALLPLPEQITVWVMTLLGHRGIDLPRRPYRPYFAGADLDIALARYEVLSRARKEVNAAVGEM